MGAIWSWDKRKPLGASLFALGTAFLLIAAMVVGLGPSAGAAPTYDPATEEYLCHATSPGVYAAAYPKVLPITSGHQAHLASGDMISGHPFDFGGTRGVDTASDADVDICGDATYTPPDPTITFTKSFAGSDTLPAGVGQGDFSPTIDTVSKSWDTAITVSAGTHTVGETAYDGDPALPLGGSFAAPSISCSYVGGGAVDPSTTALVAGDAVACTITNVYTAPAPTVTVTKFVSGGTGSVGDFALSINGAPATSGTPYTVAAGALTVTEVDNFIGPGSYTQTGNTCPATVANGDVITCTITNTWTAPGTGTITLVKEFANNDLGTTINPLDFTVEIGGNPAIWGFNPGFAPGAHTVVETDGPDGYTASYSCGGSVTVVAGENVTCTITNTYDPPTLTVVKTVIGGLASAADFNLQVNGTTIALGEPVEFDPDDGPFTVTEVQQPGYSIAIPWGGDCEGGTGTTSGAFAMVGGQDYTCTITNIDPLPYLRLVKTVVGTTDDPNAFNLTVDGGAVLHNVYNAFAAGPHQAGESDYPDWNEGPWGGACAADGSVTLAEVTIESTSWLYECTITNTFVPPPPPPPPTPFATTTTVLGPDEPDTTTTTLVLGPQLPDTGAGLSLAFLLGGFGLTLQGAGLMLFAPRRKERWVV